MTLHRSLTQLQHRGDLRCTADAPPFEPQLYLVMNQPTQPKHGVNCFWFFTFRTQASWLPAGAHATLTKPHAMSVRTAHRPSYSVLPLPAALCRASFVHSPGCLDLPYHVSSTLSRRLTCQVSVVCGPHPGMYGLAIIHPLLTITHPPHACIRPSLAPVPCG